MKNKGFTLIELMIVVAIIGILMVVFFGPKAQDGRVAAPQTSLSTSEAK